MKKKDPHIQKQSNSFLKYSSLGFEMMAIIAGFTFLGYKIDHWMENEIKGFTLGLMILSVVFAIVYGTRSLLKSNNNSEKPKRK